MTKSELAGALMERLPYLTKREAEIIADAVFKSTVEGLVQGERIDIRGFGSFTVRHRPAREGRNPSAGETVHIAAKRFPHFRLGKGLYDRINRTTD